MAIDALLENVQIELKETDACTREMNAKYSAEQVDAAFKDAVKEAGKYAQLPGFRKGKAPASLILSKYKNYILDDVAKVLQQAAFQKLTGNKDLIAAFTKDPAALLKQLGINIPQEQINKLIELVKEKLGDQTTKSILDKIKSFFKK